MPDLVRAWVLDTYAICHAVVQILASMQTLCYMIFDHVCSAIVLVARVDSGMVRLILWDLGGQEDLQTLWDKVCTGNFKTPRDHACKEIVSVCTSMCSFTVNRCIFVPDVRVYSFDYILYCIVFFIAVLF